MTVKISQEQINDLFFEGEITVDGVRYETVEEGEFEQDGKMQSAELIFTDGNKFFRGYIYRTGSPFTDWHYEDYGDDDAHEVEKKEVVITKWVAI